MTEELPDGWANVLLLDAFKLNPTKPKATEYEDDMPVTFVPMAAVEAESGSINNATTRTFAEVRKGFTAFSEGDVILAKITPCMENGKAAVVGKMLNGLGFGSTEFHVFRSYGSALPEFLFHFIRQESFRRTAADEMTGSVGQKRVPAEYLNGVELPLPPLAEQKRIVAAVERILDKVESARERLERVPTTLKRFRQAVLASACSGRLTADWREKNGFGEVAECWTSETASEICELVQSGTTPRDRTVVLDSGIPFLKVYNIVNQKVAFKEKPQFITEEIHLGNSRRAIAKPGDVIMNIVGPPLGKVAIIPNDFPEWSVNQAITIFRSGPRITRDYIFHLLCSGIPYEDVLMETRGSAGQSNISLSQCRNMKFQVPPLPEQAEIVRRVSALFALADTIEQRAKSALKRVESLKQSVLAKAFRGELVPTEAELARRENRSYEPASALLARIRTSTEAVTKPKTNRRKVKEVSNGRKEQ